MDTKMLDDPVAQS